MDDSCSFIRYLNSNFDKFYNMCMIGAGVSGSVLAECYASVYSERPFVMDVRTHIGGNCYEFV